MGFFSFSFFKSVSKSTEYALPYGPSWSLRHLATAFYCSLSLVTLPPRPRSYNNSRHRAHRGLFRNCDLTNSLPSLSSHTATNPHPLHHITRTLRITFQESPDVTLVLSSR